MVERPIPVFVIGVVLSLVALENSVNIYQLKLAGDKLYVLRVFTLITNSLQTPAGQQQNFDLTI